MTRCDTSETNDDTVNGLLAQTSSEKKLSVDQLKELIEEIENVPLRIGDKWYVVSIDWWTKFTNAITKGYPEDAGKINCSRISIRKGNSWFLREKLVERMEFVLVPGDAFKALYDTFGVEDQERDVIERSVHMNIVRKQAEVEIYPKYLQVALARDRSKTVQLLVANDDTVASLGLRALKELELQRVGMQDIRFYIQHANDRYELLNEEDAKKNYEHFFAAEQTVVVDVHHEDGWFIQQPQKILNSSSSSTSNGHIVGIRSERGISAASFRWRSAWLPFWLLALPGWLMRWLGPFLDSNLMRRIIHIGQLALGGFLFSSPTRSRTIRSTPGVCGLQNLGNTCFMASAIQCLSNVPPISQYFLSGDYEKEINVDNPLGTHGELARAYANLLKDMWSGFNTSVNPRPLKMTIGQFAPRFSGYSQQDAQELMAFLLDGLHEDLNRIKKKPYFEEDGNNEGKPDEEVASIQWEQYRARNDSIIVDKVHGQIKSTLVCPICQKISIKFDPFCFLSLPLPPRQKLTRRTFMLIFNPVRRWARFSMNITTTTTVKDALALMREVVRMPDLKVVMYTMENDHVKILQDYDVVCVPDYVYAAQLDGPCDEFIVVKNHSAGSNNRSLSLPMVFGVQSNPDDNDKEPKISDWVDKVAVPFIKEQWFRVKEGEHKDAMEEDTSEEEKQYEIASETTRGSVGTIVLRWTDPARFNGFTGKDLVERECSVTVRTEINLTECIDLFTKEEQLGEHDSWYCPQCKKHQKASKKLDLWRLPEVLIIHLKRFSYTRYSREKIDIAVHIPVSGFEINDKLANAKHEHVMFDLIAMSHHSGGLGGGHYYASALNPNTKWYDFNDASACERNPPVDPFKASSPYILVYRRREQHADNNIEMETDE